jgi:predicted DNA-binding protein with PD1-like motif
MEYRRFGNSLVVRVDRGEEIVEKLMEAVKAAGVKAGAVSGLGATNDVTIGVLNLEEKQYHANEFKGTFEIVSLLGSVSTMNGEAYLHLHMSIGDEQGRVFGGHLNRAMVSATAEIVVQIMDGTIERRKDESVGINLMRFID